jgi:hypothetical protein
MPDDAGRTGTSGARTTRLPVTLGSMFEQVRWLAERVRVVMVLGLLVVTAACSGLPSGFPPVAAPPEVTATGSALTPAGTPLAGAEVLATPLSEPSLPARPPGTPLRSNLGPTFSPSPLASVAVVEQTGTPATAGPVPATAPIRTGVAPSATPTTALKEPEVVLRLPPGLLAGTETNIDLRIQSRAAGANATPAVISRVAATPLAPSRPEVRTVGGPSPAPVEPGSPLLALEVGRDTVGPGEHFVVELQATGASGLASIWWWATGSDDLALQDTHAVDCAGASFCRKLWSVSAAGPGSLTLYAQARDARGELSELVRRELRVE